MSDAFFLTAEDCNKLSRLIAEHGLTKIVHRQEDWLPGTPEVYVARPNSAAGTGTGSGATVPALTPKADGEDYDHPGYALCDIYQFTWKAAGGNWDITPISDYSQPVFNISPTAIGDTWFLIIKTKQGHWIASYSSPLIPIILKESLTPGGTADAYVCKSDWTIIDEETPYTIEVTDTIGDKRALGKDDLSSDPAKGYAVALADGTYAIVEIRQRAKMCYCQAKIASGNTLATVDNVSAMDGGQSPVASSSTELSVSSDFETDNDAYGIIVWDETADVWRPLDFPCKT